ncbi:MAG TPA: hypothetical protein VKA04_09445 [Pseudodesulfovibrio sp.]|nr:hypothetical protein [Pseudodesulfovibrio sp.]
MSDRITFESLAPEREAEVLALARTVFNGAVAPGFSEQGRDGTRFVPMTLSLPLL